MAYNTEYLGPPLVGVSKEWPIKTLEMVCLDIFDCPHSTPKLTNKGPYMVRTQDIRSGYFDLSSAVHVSYETYAERTKRAIPTSGDIFLSREGTYFGDAAEVPKDIDVCLGQRMVLLRPNPSLIRSSFLRIWINSRLFQNYLKAFRDGTVAERVNVSTIRQLPIPIPSFFVQDNIISNVLILEQKEALNRRMNQTLEAMAQAIFQSWFVDFDPVKAKMAAVAAGRDPERAAMAALAGKLVVPKVIDEISIDDLDAAAAALDQLSEQQQSQLAQTAALFPAMLVESELGLIPVGWKVGLLEQLCKLNKKSWTTDNAPSYVNYVDLANTKNGIISEIQEYSWEDAPSRARRILTPGDTIIGTVRPGNRSFALIPSISKALTGSTGFAVLTPNRPDLREFNYLALTSDENIDRLSHLADGAAYPAVRPNVVSEFALVIPAIELLAQFHIICRPLFDRIEKNNQQSKTLTHLRDTLLPKLLSGELTVPEGSTSGR